MSSRIREKDGRREGEGGFEEWKKREKAVFRFILFLFLTHFLLFSIFVPFPLCLVLSSLSFILFFSFFRLFPGMSYLELKHHLLLAYCTNVSFFMLLKARFVS